MVLLSMLNNILFFFVLPSELSVNSTKSYKNFELIHLLNLISFPSCCIPIINNRIIFPTKRLKTFVKKLKCGSDDNLFLLIVELLTLGKRVNKFNRLLLL